MGRASREKGRRGEYEMRDILFKITGIEYRRVPLSGGLHLDFPGDLMKRTGQPDSPLDGHILEVKNAKNLKLPEWIEQCEVADEDFNGFKKNQWLLFFKMKGKWYATLPIENIERILKK